VRSVRELGLVADLVERLAPVSHAFTHRALTLDLYRLEARGGALAAPFDEARFVDATGLRALPLSTLTRKVLARAGFAPVTSLA
jgi:adenine-specific DNA glycosylase